MNINDYDKLLMLIEDNIKIRWSDMELLLCTKMYDSLRTISDFRKRVAGDGLTLIQYFKDRKMLRALEEISHYDKDDAKGITRVVYEYGYENYSTFYRSVRMKFNMAPMEVVSSGQFKCPSPKLLSDVVDNNMEIKENPELSELNKKDKEIKKLKDLNMNQIDSIEYVFNPGFAPSQKKKNVSAIHEKLQEKYPNKKVLEVSTKSENPLGIKLSAFNMVLHHNGIDKDRNEQLTLLDV